jgi:hypothetical protein
MSDHTDNNEFVDPVKEASEILLYGDPDTAAEKLRTAIHFEAARLNQHEARDGRVRSEHARSMESLRKFNDLNDAFRDPLIQAAGSAAMASEQYSDLVNAGFLNVEKFRETTGRNPSDHDIFQLHLEARANGVKGLRSTDKLLDDVATTIEEKFGVKRRVTNIDENRKRGVTERMKASAASHGTDLEGYATSFQPMNRQPNLDAGEYATPETIAARDRRDAGEGGADLTPNRKAAFDKFFANRGGGTDRRPNADVQVNRDRNSSRYPDRQAAG